MIRINRQTDYAIRFVLALAKHPERKRMSTTEIQQEMLVPSAFSPRIVAELARADVPKFDRDEPAYELKGARPGK